MDQLKAELEKVVRQHSEESDEEIEEAVREIMATFGRRVDALLAPARIANQEIVDTLVANQDRNDRRARRQLWVTVGTAAFIVAWSIVVVLRDLM